MNPHPERNIVAIERDTKWAEPHYIPPPTAASGQNAAKSHLLLVEDNLDLQRYIQLVLADKYQVTTAINGKEALNAIKEANPYQLIISDLMMPVMDGYQFLEKIKSRDATRHIPFIMLTARAAVQDKLKALRIGVDDYLHKPFDEEELLARIHNLLSNQAARTEASLTDDQPSDLAITMSEADNARLYRTAI